jgi:nucleotide-binding universal stress UspA family protein
MRILYGTDFSVSATATAHVAVELARRFGDTLVVAHIVEPPAVFSPELLAADPTLMSKLVASSEQTVGKLAASLRGAGVPMEERVAVGRPDAVLARLGEELDARLIVVGSHGRSALGRALMGTVAERLVRQSARPVLVVPPEATGALTRGGTPGRLRVVLGLERGPAGEAALAFARALRAAMPCDFSFVHVYAPEREHARLGLAGPLDAGTAETDVVAILEHELRPLVESVEGPGAGQLRIRADWGHRPDLLAWEAAGEAADLLVVGTQPRTSLLPGRSRAVENLRGATVPLLAAPAPRTESPAWSAPIAPIQSVLAATDFSPLGNAAVAQAYRLLRGSGGVVELCHAREPGREPLPPERWAELQKRLWALVPEEAQARGIVTRVSVLEGATWAEAILQAAERMSVDLVVLGSHGRSGVARALVGSVADEVVRGSSRPVVLVRRRQGA